MDALHRLHEATWINGGALIFAAVWLLARFTMKAGTALGLLKRGGVGWDWLDNLCLLLLPLCLGITIFQGSTLCGGVRVSGRVRTVANHRAIITGLTNYQMDHGVFPIPTPAEANAMIDGQSYDVAGALMLYQALSGDGDDKMRLAAGGHGRSDGAVSADEMANSFWREMPKEAVRKIDAGYILVDGFGHPFQYTPEGPDSINTTYDLWSFGETTPQAKVTKAAKQEPKVSEKWIKNW